MGDVVSSHLDEAKRGIIAGEGGAVCAGFCRRVSARAFSRSAAGETVHSERALSHRVDLCSDVFTAFYRLKECVCRGVTTCVLEARQWSQHWVRSEPQNLRHRG